jgi:hypothetical protein
MGNDSRLTRLTYTEAFSTYEEWSSDSNPLGNKFYKIINETGNFLMLDPFSAGPVDIILLGSNGDVVNQVRLYPGGSIESEFQRIKVIYQDKKQRRRLLVSSVGKVSIGAFKGDKYGSFIDSGSFSVPYFYNGATAAIAQSTLSSIGSFDPQALSFDEMLLGEVNAVVNLGTAFSTFLIGVVYDKTVYPAGLNGLPVTNGSSFAGANILFSAYSPGNAAAFISKDINQRISAKANQVFELLGYHRSAVAAAISFDISLNFST